MTDLTIETLLNIDDAPTAAPTANSYMTPKTADAGLSAAVLAETNPIPKRCYANAILAYWRAVQLVAAERGGFTEEDDEQPPIFYVEGHLVFPIGREGAMLAIEHGWLETDDGRVIETTLSEPAAGEPGWEYYTGLRLRMVDVLDRLEHNDNLTPLSMHLNRNGEAAELAAYSQAGQAAYWRAFGIDLGAGRSARNRK